MFSLTSLALANPWGARQGCRESNWSFSGELKHWDGKAAKPSTFPDGALLIFRICGSALFRKGIKRSNKKTKFIRHLAVYFSVLQLRDKECLAPQYGTSHSPPRCIGSSTPRIAPAKLLWIALNMWHRGLRDFLLQLKLKICLTASRGKDTLRTERKSTGGRSRWMERHKR